ncbi:hypothetical protein BDFB_013030 [Asbolus verrucosus]|uniref:Uncharacterized protein n=1 Tax=Asbolus verrucosus TaxID=1661398 RepID=A0A482VGG2_ASBVE|nr:hypothetical protein BDFB_013030 [Asbolus verrucosus]
MNVSKEELIKVVYILSESDRNCFLASRICKQRHPSVQHPRSETFQNLRDLFEETASVEYKKKVVTNRIETTEKNK